MRKVRKTREKLAALEVSPFEKPPGTPLTDDHKLPASDLEVDGVLIAGVDGASRHVARLVRGRPTAQEHDIPFSGIEWRLLRADHAPMALAIDTLAYARRLREAGFSEKQAESQAEALAAAMTDTLANKQDLQALATKQDLASMSAALTDRIDPVHRELEALRHGTELRLERVDGRFAQIDARIDGLEHRMEARFQELDRRLDLRLAEQTANFHGHLADLERRMTMRLGGITVAGIGVVSAFVKLL